MSEHSEVRRNPTITCDRCDLEIPATEVSQTIHLERCHPTLYQPVVDAHLDAVAEENDCPRAELVGNLSLANRLERAAKVVGEPLSDGGEDRR
jgi:hypothetical protein